MLLLLSATWSTPRVGGACGGSSLVSGWLACWPEEARGWLCDRSKIKARFARMGQGSGSVYESGEMRRERLDFVEESRREFR
jgi:hypothetical protein